jgi:hypothetical protein
LQVPRRFEPGTLLTVVLPREKAEVPDEHLVRIRWIKDLPDRAWLMGGIFVRPLDEDMLEEFLLGDLPTTDAHLLPKLGT